MCTTISVVEGHVTHGLHVQPRYRSIIFTSLPQRTELIDLRIDHFKTALPHALEPPVPTLLNDIYYDPVLKFPTPMSFA